MIDLVPALIAALLAPTGVECGNARQAAYEKARAATDPAALWTVEAQLLALPACPLSTEAPAAPPPPTRLNLPVELPAGPTGPGAGPWVMLGISAALVGGLIYVDAAADGPRGDLEAAQAAGDRAGYAEARDTFEIYQWVGRGLTAGAAVAGVTGLLWLALGGDDDPVQPRPWFGPTTAGWQVKF